MEADIYYFSGTGNSLHLAKEFQKHFPGTRLIPIVGLLDGGPVDIDSPTAGFVFPIHFAGLNIAMRKFMKKVRSIRSDYIFAIASRSGSTHRAFDDLDRCLKKKGKHLDSCFNINMPGNDPKFKGYIPATEAEIKTLESAAKAELEKIYEVVSLKKRHKEIDTGALIQTPPFLLAIIPPILKTIELLRLDARFYADSRCRGCRTCERICLAKKIMMENDRPVWQKKIRCLNCYACINFCPMHAIQLKSGRMIRYHTESNARYSHPYAASSDIAQQKINTSGDDI